MTDTIIPDLSEWNTVTDWTKVPAAIVRASYGASHTDLKWAGNAAGAAAHCSWWCAYGYLPKGIDPVAAARFFVRVLGSYRPNAVCLDLEEGDGDQRARRQAWLDTVRAELPGETEWTYSGLFFARSHLPGVRVDWIAAYQGAEPTDVHTLWQFTDARAFPGIAGTVDASLFHGGLADLARLTSPDFVSRGTAAPVSTPSPAPAPSTDPGADVFTDADKAWIKSEIESQVPAIAQAVWTRYAIHTPDGKTVDLQTALGNLLALVDPAALQGEVAAALAKLPQGTTDPSAIAKAVADQLASRLAS